jgi:glyoxylase-like metal-dependent hydrolase (beta-lactamase superfamily II)
VIFAGDVIPLAAHLSPGWISAYDAYPHTSYSEKQRMLDEAAREKQAIIYCHDAYTRCSTVRKIKDFYKTERIIASF